MCNAFQLPQNKAPGFMGGYKWTAFGTIAVSAAALRVGEATSINRQSIITQRAIAIVTLIFST